MRALAGFFVMASLLAMPLQLSAQEMTKEQVAKVEAEVLQLVDSWMDAWEDVDTDCEASQKLLHPDYWRRIPAGEVHDISRWPDYCATSTANRAGFTGEWIDKDVRVISPDAAVFVGTYWGTYEFIDDTPASHYPASAQRLLVERTATGWGISWMSYSNGPSEVVEGG